MSPEAKHGTHELLMAIMWLGIGFIAGVVVVEHQAPKHPTVFCRPSESGCEPYPWKP